MPATMKWYGPAFSKALNKEIDYDTDTIKIMLCTSSYVPDRDVHAYKSDVTNEVTAAGAYATGGATLASKSVTYDSVAHGPVLRAADVTWAGGTPTGRILVIYDSSPATDATRPLLGYVDLGGDMSVVTVQWDTAGMLYAAST